MDKRLFYAGLALIAIAIVAALVVLGSLGQSITNALTSSVRTMNLTVPANSFAYMKIDASNFTAVVIRAEAQRQSDIYVFSPGAFAAWSAYRQQNGADAGLLYARRLNESGMQLAAYANIDAANITLINSTAGGTMRNASPIAGFRPAFYFVVDGSQGSASNGSYKAAVVYVGLGAANLVQYRKLFGQAILYGAVIFLGFLAGVVLAVYGKVSKGPDGNAGTGAGGTVSKEYIDALYKEDRRRERKSKAAGKG